MKMLSIESSGNIAAVALLTDGVLTAESMTNDKKTHSQTLLPMIAAMLESVGCAPAELDAIAISKGPGSFTGLRIGAATAKGLAQAIGCPLVSVPTLEAMAYQCFGFSGLICPIMDARRNQVYGGVFRYEDGRLETLLETGLFLIEEFLDKVGELAESLEGETDESARAMFLGDAVKIQKARIEEALPGTLFAPSFLNGQRGAAVAALGYEMYLKGETVTAESFGPDYLRASQAEREREAREQA